MFVKKDKDKKHRFYIALRVLIGFCALFTLLLLERIGILYKYPSYVVDLLPGEATASAAEKTAIGDTACLLIIDTNNETSRADRAEFEQILCDMRIPYETEDIADAKGLMDDLSKYRTIIFASTDIAVLGDKLLDFVSWVSEGGNMLFALPLQKTNELNVIGPNIGIEESGFEYSMVDSFVADKDFMLGGGRVYNIEDGYESALSVGLNDKCKIYASTGDGSVPLIWEKKQKQGKFVVCNFSYCQKAYRGVYSAAISLLDDACVYPVINGSTWYLDDFPSPVPQGDGTYIERDYHMQTADFYSSVWWPDMLTLADEHNIQYTGLIIETYEDKTSENVKPNLSTSDFYYYGNMLLNRGGELGYHGYNHQPLCGPNYTYEEDHGYNVWESFKAMNLAMEELKRFSRSIFPEMDLTVYVPPSNILSSEGRYMLGHDFPDIRCIASTYFTGNDAYTQEFEIADDGIIETPRIISGGILDDYMRFAAFSELNFHFINSHFLHPDDLLDPDRGAALGWEKLKSNLSDYMIWLDESAPDIRHMTGNSLAGAVQRYCMLSCDKEITDKEIILKFSGLEDEGYCFLRINEGSIGKITGGTLTNLTGNLYLLKVTDDVVTIER